MARATPNRRIQARTRNALLVYRSPTARALHLRVRDAQGWTTYALADMEGGLLRPGWSAGLRREPGVAL